jgi:hypothetical protein
MSIVEKQKDINITKHQKGSKHAEHTTRIEKPFGKGSASMKASRDRKKAT